MKRKGQPGIEAAAMTTERSIGTAVADCPAIIRGYRELTALVRRSRPQLWRDIRDGHFPPGFELGRNAIGWERTRIEQWLATRPRRRYGAPSDGPADRIEPAAGHESRPRKTTGGRNTDRATGTPRDVAVEREKVGRKNFRQKMALDGGASAGTEVYCPCPVCTSQDAP